MISIRTGAQREASSTLDHPIEHLSACHRRIEQRLTTLDRAAAVLATRREEALQAIHNAFAFLDSNGVLHTEDEEKSLFPRLRGKLHPVQEELVAALEADHAVAHELYASLRLAVDQIATSPDFDEPAALQYASLVSRFSAFYRRHISIEDSQLAEISKAVLTGRELAEISVEMKRRRGWSEPDGQ